MTDQLKAQLEARLHLAAIVDSVADAIISKSLDGEILSWNKGAEKIYGYSKSEVLGKHISIIAPPDRYDEISGFLQKIRHAESIEHFETVRKKKMERSSMFLY